MIRTLSWSPASKPRSETCPRRPALAGPCRDAGDSAKGRLSCRPEGLRIPTRPGPPAASALSSFWSALSCFSSILRALFMAERTWLPCPTRTDNQAGLRFPRAWIRVVKGTVTGRTLRGLIRKSRAGPGVGKMARTIHRTCQGTAPHDD